MDHLVSPKPRFFNQHSSGSSSSSCPPSCPPTPRSILRSKCLQRTITRTITPSGTCHVHFSEAIDERDADDYDRSCCATAVPTLREIRELERIRRELVPSGRGITDQDIEANEPGEMCFGFDDGGDVDCQPKPKRRLKGVPIELCPILPADAPLLTPTPYNSNEPSPLSSPIVAPVDQRRPFQPRMKMAFQPLLPTEPAAPALTKPAETPIPTPPVTPTIVKLDLYADDARPNSRAPHPSDVAPPPTGQRRVSSPSRPTFGASSSGMPYVGPPSRQQPNTCRMAIMPVLSTPSTPTQRTSPSGSPRQYGPITNPNPINPVYNPLPMTFKRTART